MPQPTFWTNWPLSQRQSPPGGPASEINEAFLQDFHDRDENSRTRLCAGDNLSAQTFLFANAVWTAAAGSSVVYIPPWAERLVVRCTLQTDYSGGPFAMGTVRARPKLGTVYGTEMVLVPEYPDASTLFDEESVIDISGSMLDTEQSFSYEVRRDTGDVTFISVFNDARDATNGHRHRHWYFLEAA